MTAAGKPCRSLRAHALGRRPLDADSLLAMLGAEAESESVESIEDTERPIKEGVTWQRRRIGWTDSASGEDQGFCVNEVRVSAHSPATVRPVLAMAYPGLVNFEAVENAYWQTQWAGGAIRRDRGVKEPRLFANMRQLICSRDAAPLGPWHDLAELQRRVEEHGMRDSDVHDFPALEPTISSAEDEGKPSVARYLPAFPPSWAVQAYESVHVAINGGYFLNFPEEYEDDGVSALHQPVGGLYSDGQLVQPPWIARPVAIQWQDGERGIEILGPSNLAIVMDDLPAIGLQSGPADPNAPATVWRRHDVPATEIPEGAVDLIFCGAGLIGVKPAGEVMPPHGGALVRLCGEAAAPWQRALQDERQRPTWQLVLETSRDVPLDWCLASGPILVQHGNVRTPDEIMTPAFGGEFAPAGPPPTRFPYDADKTRAPRTAIGLTPAGEWVMVVIDGRFDAAHSVGMTLVEVGRLMRHLGCWTAMNLDGGGSSVMVVEKAQVIDQLMPELASGVVNIPSDAGNRERIVPIALTVMDSD